MPVIIRNLSDDDAVLAMVDSNLQRETILPSERAFAYKMKLDALKHQGKQLDVGGKFSVEIVAEESGESKNQIFRYIRLTYLIPELLNMVDEKKIAFNPAVELSYLKENEQFMLLESMERRISMDSKKLAAENYDYVVKLRRDFHQHPEPSMEEFRTTEKIAEQLDEIGIPYQRIEPTGLIGTIKGGSPGKTVALRADIDALSIKEKSGVEFASVNEGYMHACGHDTHAAWVLQKLLTVFAMSFQALQK